MRTSAAVVALLLAVCSCNTLAVTYQYTWTPAVCMVSPLGLTLTLAGVATDLIIERIQVMFHWLHWIGIDLDDLDEYKYLIAGGDVLIGSLSLWGLYHCVSNMWVPVAAPPAEV